MANEQNMSALESVLIDTIKKSTEVGGDIYNASKTALSKSIDFASEQIPDIMHQIVMWELVSSIVWLVVGVIIFCFGFYNVKLCKESTCSGSQEAYVFVALVSFILSLIIIIKQTLNICYVTFAPKLFLIDYVVNIINKIA